MTQREARNVQILLDWVLNLAAFEHAQDAATDVVSDDEFVRIVGFLADRSWEVFGAGLRQDAAIAAAMRLLGYDTTCRTTQADVDVVDLELPELAGPARCDRSGGVVSGYYDRQGNRLTQEDALKPEHWGMDRRRVALDQVGDLYISTVHLVIDHQCGEGPPIIFETMVFVGALGSGEGVDCWRYATEAEALAGHAEIVESLRLIREAIS